MDFLGGDGKEAPGRYQVATLLKRGTHAKAYMKVRGGEDEKEALQD
jgi:hypothetical protein